MLEHWLFIVFVAWMISIASRGQDIRQLAMPQVEDSQDKVKSLIAEHAYMRAETVLHRLLEATPEDHALLVLEALNYFYEHKYVESREVIRGLAEKHAMTAEVWVLSGLLDVVSNDLGSAEKAFRHGTESDAANAAAHYYLGRTLYMRQEIDAAVMEFARAIALDKNFIQAYDAMGLAYAVKEDPDEAKIWFERGMVQDARRGGPKMEWLWLDLAAMLLTYHRSAEAERYLIEAERINASNPQLYLEMGKMYFQENNYIAALKAYGRVLELDPSNAPAHYFRGRAYHYLRQNDLARVEFVQFEALNQQHTMYEARSPKVEGADERSVAIQQTNH